VRSARDGGITSKNAEIMLASLLDVGEKHQEFISSNC